MVGRGLDICMKFSGDKNAKGNLDRRSTPMKILVDRMNEQRPSILQVGDHHHAEDTADELAPTFRIGLCGAIDRRFDRSTPRIRGSYYSGD
jgi:hypothetical protein